MTSTQGFAIEEDAAKLTIGAIATDAGNALFRGQQFPVTGRRNDSRVAASAECSDLGSRLAEGGQELALCRINLHTMTSGVGTINAVVEVGYGKTIAGHDEAYRALDEAGQCAVKIILADVLVCSVGHKNAIRAYRNRTVVGCLAAGIPLLHRLALAVVHLNAGREKRKDAPSENGDITQIAGCREVGLQLAAQPIDVYVIRRSDEYAAALYVQGTDIIWNLKAKGAPVR